MELSARQYCRGAATWHNGSVDGLFKTRGLWLLTQLPAEQKRDGREFWLKQLEESGSGVMTAAWNDNGRQGASGRVRYALNKGFGS